MNTMVEVADKAWSWAFCRAIRARQHAKELLREERARRVPPSTPFWWACLW